MIKRFLAVVIFFLIFLTTKSTSLAVNERYVTIIHPIRAKNFWQSVDSVKAQIDLVVDNQLSTTWLVQYSAIEDGQLFDLFNKLPQDQEIGIFLEIDEKLTNDALVGYKIGSGDWARADKILLSGYSLPERKRVIDTIFRKFKKVFGFYPSSVGAWYIDTISLNYIVDRYKIKAVLDVADQYQTDGYGVWGKPWGTAYYPSRTNSLIPSRKKENQLDVVKIQWAQRDPVRGYGLSVFDSTYSLQANDYIGHHGLDINYFKSLSNVYLDSPNTLNQLTVGLEVGQEAASFFDEYKKQIRELIELKDRGEAKFVTMSDFAKKFRLVNPGLTPNFLVIGSDIEEKEKVAFWFSSPFYRVGLIKEGNKLRIRDLRVYDGKILFDDIFEKDMNWVLKRVIPDSIDKLQQNSTNYLIDNIKNITTKREGGDVVIEAIDNLDGVHELRLASSSIKVDSNIFLNIPTRATLVDKLRERLPLLTVNYFTNLYHSWKFSFRWSIIESTVYIGLWIFPDKLFGIRSSSPYVGVFTFPFQTLANFKSLPKFY